MAPKTMTKRLRAIFRKNRPTSEQVENNPGHIQEHPGNSIELTQERSQGHTENDGLRAYERWSKVRIEKRFISIANAANSPLLRLPGELRNKIYRMALIWGIARLQIQRGRDKQPALIQVCRQIRREAFSIFFQEAPFQVDIVGLDGTDIIEWMRPHRGRFTNGVTLNLVGDPSWPNLLRWMQEIHAGRAEYWLNECSRPDLARFPNTLPRVKRIEAVLYQCMQITVRMAKIGSRWEEVEGVLECMHQALGAHDRRWLEAWA
ncbi:hypothetical protein LTR66_004870 [Elasticomyces elasticus]|nr:hypothetical protein LTR66_004870 [Elasticomyces elasticus]